MRAAVLAAYGSELSIEEVPAPEVAGGSDVIVRIGGAGLCRTDLHVIEGFFRERVDVELPYVLGHENAGWVEDVGPDVRSLKPGDAVIVHPVVSCGRCPACRRGEEMHCADQAFPGITADGGFAEYLRTGERAVIALPDGVEPAAVAPHADAGLTAYRAARRAAEGLGRGSRCAVIGVGGLGHIALQLLRELSEAEIVAVDRSGAALGLAARLGAEHLVDASVGDPVEAVMELTGGRGADAVIDFVGEEVAIGQALGHDRDRGHLLGRRLRRHDHDPDPGDRRGRARDRGRRKPGRHLRGARRADAPRRRGAGDAARVRVPPGRRQRGGPGPRGRQAPGGP